MVVNSPPSIFIKGSPLTQMWYKWKAIRFPWRKKYYIGMDLQGNTFWEFRERLNASRPRRIMEYKGGHSFLNYQNYKIDPSWHQWLRNTRPEPPSIPELEAELQRQAQMVHRARIADEKWANKPSLLTQPKAKLSKGQGDRTTTQLEEQLRVERDKRGGGDALHRQLGTPTSEGEGSAVGVKGEVKAQAQTATSESTLQGKATEKKDWQPEAWSPGPARRG